MKNNTQGNCPRTLITLFEKLAPERDIETLTGDMQEMYERVHGSRGRNAAYVWFFLLLIRLMPSILYNALFRISVLFGTSLRIFFRNFRRQKAFTVINVLGLAVGMASIVLTLLFVRYESGFDSFHDKNIYRVEKEVTYHDRPTEYHALTSGKMAGSLVEDYPEILKAVKIFNWYRQLIILEDRRFYLNNVLSADEDFFSVFNFRLLEGSPENVLSEPGQIVLTKESAEIIFPKGNPVGKTVNLENELYTVSGIVQNPPANSHIQFTAICSWVTTEGQESMTWLNNWLTQCMYTYVVLDDGADPAALDDKLIGFMARYLPNRTDSYKMYLKPLEDIHLRSIGLRYDFNFYKGNINYLYIFPAVALFILAIGCLNFINLSTARSAERSREVGMRKVIGARRGDLILQFVGESVLLAFTAMLIGILIAWSLFPVFTSLINRQLELHLFSDLTLVFALILISAAVGITAGIYPALILSAFKPVNVLKSRYGFSGQNNFMRKGLVVFQFSIAIFLIIGTLTVYNQLQYIQKKNLGFNKDQLITIPNRFRSDITKYETQKNRLLRYPGILEVTGTRHVPGTHVNTYEVYPESRPEGESWIVGCMAVDYNFIQVMGIDVLSGRDFSKEFPTDAETSIIINETFAANLGWDEPLGREIAVDTDRNFQGKIIGVVRDFSIKSVHQKIEPLIMFIHPEQMSDFLVRVSTDDISGSLAYLEEEWQTYDPSRPFQYRFIDEYFARFYESEKNLGMIFAGFSFLVIFTACIGLFGLTSFLAQFRKKEIAVRKLLGESVPGIYMILTKNLVISVLISNIIAWPAAWYAMNRWLQNFAYRTDISIAAFIFAGLAALIIALIATSFQAFNAAVSNPVDSLRGE